MITPEQLDAEIKSAMLARDKTRTDTLRGLKSALTYHTTQTGKQPTPGDILLILRREIKKRQDAIAEFTKAARPELVQAEESQLKILETFLPATLTPEELEAIVRDAIAETGATSKKQMGLVMKAAQAKAAGRADNAALSAKIQALLPA